MGSSGKRYAIGFFLLFALQRQTFVQSYTQSTTRITTTSVRPSTFGCGSSKGCFPDCTNDCDYLVTWSDRGSYIEFTLSAAPPVDDWLFYIAIGFSDDYRMGDDSVVACISYSRIEASYTEGTKYHVLFPSTYGLETTMSLSYVDGYYTCAFNRNISASDSRFFDLNNDYYIQLVTGKTRYDGGTYLRVLDKHEAIPWFSDQKVDFQSNETVGAYKLNSPLVKLHGSMMVIAWLLFSIIGIATARYNRNMLPGTTLFGTRVWFQVHRCLMVAVVVCVVIGFISILVEIEGYSQIVPAEYNFVSAHPVLGIIIMCFTLLNPLGALFRPDPDHKYRWIFNRVHFGVGVITQILAVLSIMFGYFTVRAGLSTTPAKVTAAYIFCSVFFLVFLGVRKWSGFEGSEHESGDNLQSESQHLHFYAEEPKPPTHVSFVVLVVFSIVTTSFVITLLKIIASD